MEEILKFIGGVVAIGGSSAFIAYNLFKWLGKSWIEHKFAKELESFRSEKQKDLEQVRHQINTEFSRVSKIHSKEFEVLPKAWELAHLAYGKVHDITRGLKYYPQLDDMSEIQLAEVLATSKLSESSKDRLLKASDKSKVYQDEIFWIEFAESRKAQIELNNFLHLNSIFMTETLESSFQEMNSGLQRILTEHEIGTKMKLADMLISSSQATGELSKKFDSLKVAVKDRLQYEKA